MNPEEVIVSVVMPVYNGEKFLGKSIESVLSQTFTKFELIIVEDGSTDNSPEISKKYEKSDSRVRVLSHENSKNLGVSTSRNLGIEKSRGKYISFCDADDLWDKEKIDKQLKVFSDNSDVILCHTAIHAFGSSDLFCEKFERSNNISSIEKITSFPITPR